ncbi:MAG TPA: TIGR03089 family protein [Jatrophihabitantaceae bacterium]|nr:TIGR03089 family protein [Jatrophihabitantaceae bacterium]
MTTPEQLFADLLSREPGRPFITYYDEATGERSELSATSLANWVAKTHHLLATELGLGADDGALLAVPAHWISIPPLLAALTAGLQLVDDAASAEVAFVEPATLEAAAGVPDVYAVAPDAARVGFGPAVPVGAEDYVTAVRPQADAWGSVRFGAGPDDPCFAGRTRAEVADWARERAAELGLAAGARVLATRDWSGPSDWVDTLLAPLSVGGSLVYVRNCTDPDVLERRATQERATTLIS